MAVEHQVLAAATAVPTANHVGASFLHLLPRDLQSELPQHSLHVLRHVELFAGGTWNIDDVAAHGHDFFFLDLGKDLLHEPGIRCRLRIFG